MRPLSSISDQKISLRLCRFSAAKRDAKFRSSRQGKAGVTLVETMVSLMVLLIGMAGLFGTSARSYSLLRRSKEVVAVRESLLTRLDGVRALSFAEVARSIPPTTTSGSSTTQTGSLSTKLLTADAAGDPTPFGVTLTSHKSLTETVTVYALGTQLFSSDAQRNAATPDYKDVYASQFDSPAPAPPTTYKASSDNVGAWVQQVAGALPYYTITRVGTGSTSKVTIDNTNATVAKGAIGTGDLSNFPLLRVDVVFTWTDSNNVTRTQVGSTLVSRNGSLQ